MPEAEEITEAVNAANDGIDDLQRRLGWHDNPAQHVAGLRKDFDL